MGSGQAGFGNSPSWRAIKVTIVGSASPRWRGVSADEADRRNYQLSNQRAEATKQQTVAILRKHFGPTIPIQFDVSNAPGDPGRELQVGSYGVGSSQTLQDARGNRNDNSDFSRRVEVSVEMVTTKGTVVEQSLPPLQISASTAASWYVSIKEIHVAALAVVRGEVTLIFRNGLSGKKMLAKATITGGGLNSTLISGKKGVQWKAVGADLATMFLTKYPETSFYVNREIGFGEFENVLVRLEKVEGKLGYGATVIYMTMLGFGEGTENISLFRKTGWGLPKLEGWVASGRLHLQGTEPGDYWEEDQVQQTMAYNQRRQEEELILTFATGSAVLLPADRIRLTEYMDTWARRMFGP